ncbi:MAG: MFS transporter [Proteobacteria bacterium]|nr:MFS transporter [Pseudomonadota bacterium]
MNTESASSLLKEPGFIRLWVMGAVAGTARWLEMLVIGIFVFDTTGSPFTVALMLFARLVPMGVFGVFGGLISDRYDRRRTLLLVVTLMALVSATLCLLGVYGKLTVWHVGIGAFVAGLAWVTDFPVRRTLLAEIAGPGRTAKAMSLDIMSSSGTRMLGPVLGGGLYVTLGIEGAFLMTMVFYGLCFVLLLGLAHRDAPAPTTDASPFHRLMEGFRELQQSRLLIGIFIVTIIFNLWGFPFTSMIPVIGKDVLLLDPAGVGVLASAEGLGALVGAVLLALYAPGAWARYLYVGGVGLYFALIIAFGFSASTPVSGMTLTLAGCAGAGFAAMQSALILMNANERTRGRMMGVLSMCIGTGLLGFLHLGWLADLIGPGAACITLGLEGLLAMGVTVYYYPELLGRQA